LLLPWPNEFTRQASANDKNLRLVGQAIQRVLNVRYPDDNSFKSTAPTHSVCPSDKLTHSPQHQLRPDQRYRGKQGGTGEKNDTSAVETEVFQPVLAS
jgi:hypothetical protein